MNIIDKNVAGSKEYLDYREKFTWLFQLEPDSSVEQKLSSDFLLEIFSYHQEKINPSTGCLASYSAVKALLKDSGENLIKEIECIDDHFFAQIINHSNGKQYLIYNTDLYGYSVLDMSTLETADYVPYKSFFGGETFIWCEKHYSPVNDLLVVDGCYWACPWGLEFYNFSQPMQLPLHKYGDSFQLEEKLEVSIDDDVAFVGFTQEGSCIINCLDSEGKAKQKIVSLAQLKD